MAEDHLRGCILRMLQMLDTDVATVEDAFIVYHLKQTLRLIEEERKPWTKK